ncbi:MAG: HAD-IIB family hydrolase [Pseudomonadota bacterium]
MRYHALACDYDGTLASHGHIDDDTRAALDRLIATGRRLILVTGRRVDDLQTVCPDLSPFALVVAENGAVLYDPAARELRALVEPPPRAFAETLAARGASDVARGEVIVATWQPHEALVLEIIREMGLELQVIFNKGAVMVLPSGVNKATGLHAALGALRLSPHNVVGIGDGENDHALLTACECGVAVANAVPMLRERADLVTAGHQGRGVVELADRLMANDLRDLTPPLTRHDLPLGADPSGAAVTLPAHGANVLLCGTSGAGKSTLATAFMERLDERGYQYCILDPEGDYNDLPRAVTVGTQKIEPNLDDITKLLDKPDQNVTVNLLGVGLSGRPAFFDKVLPRVQAQRDRSGRPQWLILDEVHHLAPQSRPLDGTPPEPPLNLFLITVHPAHVSHALLESVDIVLVVGTAPKQMLVEFADAVGLPPPELEDAPLPSGEAMLWWPRRDRRPIRLTTTPSRIERRRHIRKYADGEIQPERSFYFRGPEGKLNLRAQNLMSFLQIGDGVDDGTWNFHLRAGDYSRWFEHVVKDRDLASEVAAVERADRDTPTAESRRAVREAVERRYTAPP